MHLGLEFVYKKDKLINYDFAELIVGNIYSKKRGKKEEKLSILEILYY